MVAIVTDKLRRVSPRGQNAVFDSGNVPRGAFNAGGERFIDTGGIGKGVSDLGDSLSSIGLQMQEEDNETRAKEADVRISEKIRGAMMGDPNDPASPGFLNTRGNDTLNGFGAAESVIRAAVQEEIETAGKNRHLQALIQQRAQRRVDVSLDRMTGHTSEQRLVVQERASLAREAQALADVSADWQSDAVLNDALKDVAAESLDRADSAGMGDDATAAMLAQRQSVIVNGAFQAALVSQDVTRAQAIFNAHADKLDGPTRTKMAQALAVDIQKTAAQKLATEAVGQFPSDPAAARAFIRDAVDGAAQSAAITEYNDRLREKATDFRNREAMRAAHQRAADRALPGRVQELLEQVGVDLGPDATPGEIRQHIQKNFGDREEEAMLNLLQTRLQRERGDISHERSKAEADRAVRAGARAEANHWAALRAREERENLIEARSAASSYLYSTPRQGEAPPSMAEFRRRNPELFAVLAAADGSVINSLEATERNIARGQIYARVSDNKTLNELKFMPIPERASVNPKVLQPNLTESEFRQAESAILAAKKAVESDGRNRAVYNTGNSALRRFIPEGFEKGKKKTDQLLKVAEGKMLEWIADRIEEGKFPTVPEITKEAAEIMMPVIADFNALNPLTAFETDFAGIAAQVDTLDEAQKAILTVPVESIPKDMLDTINRVVQEDWTDIELSDLTDDVLEELAGAALVGDLPRIDKILKGLGGTKIVTSALVVRG